MALAMAVACAVTLVACEPKGRAKETAIHETPEFQESIETFAWPSEPSHVIALEIAGRGTVRMGLYDQVAPITVAHVVDCVARGVYDDTLFHRVIKDFMVQGGDPNTRKRGPGTTRGDWGSLRVEDEFQAIHHDRGVVAMANRGRKGSAGSQFFIVHQDSHHLDGKYSAFGRVLSGMDVVDAIAEIDTDKVGRWGEKHTPLENVILQRATVERGAVAAQKAEPAATAETDSTAATQSG
jgi:peptidyl-prolyl cis-trans isomerase B (cyclophilin B)